MKYQIDAWSNFCRVFEIPEDYPEGFCHDGGKPVNFQMIDCFYPLHELPQPAVSKEIWKEKVGNIQTAEIDGDEKAKEISDFLKKRNYMKPGRKYLVICDFGLAFTFHSDKQKD